MRAQTAFALAIAAVSSAGPAIAQESICAAGKAPQTSGHFIMADPEDWGEVTGLGFNIMNLEISEDIAKLPDGMQGIAQVGECNGVTEDFKRRVMNYANRDPSGTKVKAYYIMDEPTPDKCDPANIHAQSEWIHQNVKGAKTFIALFETAERFGDYAKNVDYVAVDPYPCEESYCDYSYIPRVVKMAIDGGVPKEKIIPTYQAYGKDGDYMRQLNSIDYEKMLATWSSVIGNAPFDYTWTWMPIDADVSLKDSPNGQQFFKEMNACLADGEPVRITPIGELPVTATRGDEFANRDKECKAREAEFDAATKGQGSLTDAQKAGLADMTARCGDMRKRWEVFARENECAPATAAEKNAFKVAAIANGGISTAQADALNFDCAKPEDRSSNEPDNETSGTLTVLSTGDATRDKYDALIVEMSKKYGYPDPRFIKAQIEWESHFDTKAVSGDSPCGGSGQQSKSLGLLQVTPQCGEGVGGDMFDPRQNLDAGIAAIASGYRHFQQAFPGCSQSEYENMAAAGYVQDWGTIVGCNEYTDARQDEYLRNVNRYYAQWYGNNGGNDN